MTARDWLPAHLVPPGELHGDFGRLTFGTPLSPSVILRPPAIVTVRQIEAYGSELYVRAPDGAPIILSLNEDQLLRLADEVVSGLRRAHAERRINERRDHHER